jgi:hypothetical protein
VRVRCSISIEVRKENIQVDGFYEISNITKYKSFRMNFNYGLGPDKKLSILLGKELTTIQWPKHLYPFLALLSELDYHLVHFFNYLKGEIKPRPGINDKNQEPRGKPTRYELQNPFKSSRQASGN